MRDFIRRFCAGKGKKAAAVALAGSGLVASSAFAQSGYSIDPSSVTAVLTAVAAAGGTIGLAYLATVAGIKGYKMVLRAM